MADEESAPSVSDRDGAVLELTLTRPELYNHFDDDLHAEFVARPPSPPHGEVLDLSLALEEATLASRGVLEGIAAF